MSQKFVFSEYTELKQDITHMQWIDIQATVLNQIIDFSDQVSWEKVLNNWTEF